MVTLPQNNLQIQRNPYHNPNSTFFFSRNGKTCPKIHMQSQGNPEESKQLWIRKSWETFTFWFQILLQTFINQSTVWSWHKDRHTDQSNRTENPEINLHIYGQLILTRMPRPFSGERTVPSTNGDRKLDINISKHWTLILTTYTRINSKWITDLDVRAKAIKLLEVSIQANLCTLELVIVS